MSFWSALAHIGTKIAAPFTGGASLALDPAIDAVSGMIGGATKAASANRGAANTEQLSRDRLSLDARTQLENALMNRHQMDLAERKSAGKDLYRADYLQNWQPAARPAGVPMTSFVRAPGEELKNAMASIGHQAAGRLTSPMYNSSTIAGPTLFTPTPPKKAGFWEKFGTFAGPILGGLGAIGKAAGGGNEAGSYGSDITSGWSSAGEGTY